METIESYSMSELRGYLDAVGDLLTAPDYLVSFDISTVRIGTIHETTSGILLSKYPESRPDFSVFQDVSWEELESNLRHKIRIPLVYSVSPKYKAEMEERLLAGVSHRLLQCFSHRNLVITEYIPSPEANDILFDFVYWGFTYVICDYQSKIALIFHAGASD